MTAPENKPATANESAQEHPEGETSEGGARKPAKKQTRIAMSSSAEDRPTDVFFAKVAKRGEIVAGPPGSRVHLTVIPNLNESSTPTISIHATGQDKRSRRVEFDPRSLIDLLPNMVREFDSGEALRAHLRPGSYVFVATETDQARIREASQSPTGGASMKVLPMLRASLDLFRGPVAAFDFRAMPPNAIAFLQRRADDSDAFPQIVSRLPDGRFRLVDLSAVKDLLSSLSDFSGLAEAFRGAEVPAPIDQLNREIDEAVRREFAQDPTLVERLNDIARLTGHGEDAKEP